MKMKLAGIVLVALGLAVALVPVKYIDRGSMNKGLMSSTVLLRNDLDVTYMDVKKFRSVFPQYADMDGEELALRLHTRYFYDMSLDEYKQTFLTRSSPATGAAGGDPVMVRGEIDEIKPPDVAAQAVYSIDAANLELIEYRVDRIEFPYTYAFIAGALVLLCGIAAVVVPRKKTA